MNKNKIIKTTKPITCTGIIRIPNKKALGSIKQLLSIWRVWEGINPSLFNYWRNYGYWNK